MDERLRAIREFELAIHAALQASEEVEAARRRLREQGMDLSHIDVAAYLTLASMAAAPRPPDQSDAEFLKSLRIAPDVTPESKP
ncbi:MAG TPA: hypothetical protein VHX37_13310 [Acidobacteriaceae bacterium]|nr:hypothetical protein [Acidobacteriaceae bacterium]